MSFHGRSENKKRTDMPTFKGFGTSARFSVTRKKCATKYSAGTSYLADVGLPLH